MKGVGLLNAIQIAPTTSGDPAPQLSGNSLIFSGMAAGSNPAAQSVTISNTGGGALKAASSTDFRALEQPSGADRFAATWYAVGSFSFDVNFTDGLTRQLALYAMDYDNSGRSQRIDVIDSASERSPRFA